MASCINHFIQCVDCDRLKVYYLKHVSRMLLTHRITNLTTTHVHIYNTSGLANLVILGCTLEQLIPLYKLYNSYAAFSYNNLIMLVYFSTFDTVVNINSTHITADKPIQ